MYQSNGNLTTWAGIQGGKANATDGNAGGYLRFFTRPLSNAAYTEKMRIDSEGNVTIGTALASGGTVQVFANSPGNGVAGVRVDHIGPSVGAGYGLLVTKSGASAANIAGYFDASGGAINYGLVVKRGSVGLGTDSPTKEVDAVGTIRAKETATANVGVEQFYGSGAGNVIAFDRDSSAYLPLQIDGITLALNALSHGNVGIGRVPDTPGSGLQVQTGIRSYGSIVADTQSISTTGGGNIVSSGSYFAGSKEVANSNGCLYA